MTPRDLRNIHTTGNSCRDALPCTNMALKLPRYIYLLMEKPTGHYFHVRSPYCKEHITTRKPLFLYPKCDKPGLRNPIKDKHQSTLIRCTTSIHLAKPVSTDLINPVFQCPWDKLSQG